jgi:glycosyltransferase involved in cell wall biosynthesis
MPKLLTVSFASLNVPHRQPFDQLGREPGWEVHVAAPAQVAVGGGRFKPCAPVPAGAAYTLHQLSVRFQDASRFVWFRGLAPLILRLRPDYVLAEHDPGSVAVLHAFLASRPWGAKIVPFTVENIARDRWASAAAGLKEGRFKQAAIDALVGGMIEAGEAASAALACINPEGARIYGASRGWKKPLAVIPLGTDLDLFKPRDATELRRSLGLADRFVVGYFGRLVPEKGVLLLVEALSRLPPSHALLLDMYANFSPGSYAAEVLARAEALGVRDRIVTIDVPHARVPEHMSCCDVVVLPSRSTDRWKEQFGRVLPEAMACGVPVVGSESGNIPEMIGDAGLIVPEGSAEAIAAAVLSLAGDAALRDRLRLAGRARVAEKFSVAVQVRLLKELLLAAG